jgi:peptidoglycan lytic transglycosylase
MIPRRHNFSCCLLGAGLCLGLPVGVAAEEGRAGTPGGSPTEIRIALAARHAGKAEDAIRVYLEAAERLPEVADWLVLRAAALTRDSVGRAALYARIRTPAAQARILPTEARAREDAGDLAGAAVRYDSLAQYSDATRLRLQMAWTERQREALRAGLLQVIRQRPGDGESTRSLELLAELSVALTPQEALDAARLAARSNAFAPAATLYPRAGRLATSADLLSYGQTLVALRRYRQAARIYQRVRSDSAVARAAALGQAWAYARMGQSSRASRAVDELLARVPDDTAIRPRALFLAGNLAWQRGDRPGARQRWSELIARFPGADSSGRAGFLSALTLYEEGRATQAAEQWERVHLINGRGDGLAAGYWAGRAWSEVGDSLRAAGMWQSVIARDSSSYYGFLSARRLSVTSWRPVPEVERFVEYPDLDSAMARIGILRSLEMDDEAGYEISWLTFGRRESVERVLAVADALRSANEPAAAVAAARLALGLGARPDTRTYRLLYPWHFADDLEVHATAAGLDPFLVAALIRQESNWESRARSRVGALGLMQVMPTTGRAIARALRVRGWRADQLYEPSTNLRFGSWYLAQALRRFSGVVAQALAAYNAGPSRVGEWASGPAAEDPELFIERIDLRETRNYVRTILRNFALYRMLYGAVEPAATQTALSYPEVMSPLAGTAGHVAGAP